METTTWSIRHITDREYMTMGHVRRLICLRKDMYWIDTPDGAVCIEWDLAEDRTVELYISQNYFKGDFKKARPALKAFFELSWEYQRMLELIEAIVARPWIALEDALTMDQHLLPVGVCVISSKDGYKWDGTHFEAQYYSPVMTFLPNKKLRSLADIMTVEASAAGYSKNQRHFTEAEFWAYHDGL